VAFRAQDEELYVTESAIANAVGRAGAPAALVLDLRRARAALSAYLDAHRPCALDLVEIAGVEHGALTSLEAAIAALADGADAGAQLETARVMLRRVASSLAGGT
jgi:hypothetical protein